MEHERCWKIDLSVRCPVIYPCQTINSAIHVLSDVQSLEHRIVFHLDLVAKTESINNLNFVSLFSTANGENTVNETSTMLLDRVFVHALHRFIGGECANARP